MKKIFQAFLILVLIISGLTGGCKAQSTLPEPPKPSLPQEFFLDSDKDGMNDWFEVNIAHLDPLTPNNRYAIILGTDTIHPNPYYTQQRREEMTDLKTFLVQGEKFKPENVFLLMDVGATYSNFQNAMGHITENSDENDLVYIMTSAHGGENGFWFHSGKDPSEIEIPREMIENNRKWYSSGTSDEEIYKDLQIITAASGHGISVDEINELMNGIKHKKMFLVIDTCGLSKLVSKLSGKNLVTAYLSGCLQTFMLGKGFSNYAFTDTDQNSYPSISELFNSLCQTILNGRSINSIGVESEVLPKIFDPQGLSADFYFGDAKINPKLVR